ncbi:mRNA decay activator protein ZFP36L1 [Anolis carolinensis]|uniref:mRNA decay activator protein ZFP36 n=1 Tax=Anolis carolinensis TaxID=28377 RepID=A0A803T913_ANOCA|nr:PREDICTED: tristetraprolin [Anolis carolinensis]|eukprot:XP_008118981.1 PREDICTED: tristetraprolin [Anolis carolinensis]
MPSDFLSPFVELDDALCKNFLSLNVDGDVRAQTLASPVFHRALSACPVALLSSDNDAIALCSTSDQSDLPWPRRGPWGRDHELPRTVLQDLPFRADRSVSLIEGKGALSSSSSSRYKTELCRTFEESGSCKYGAKCQFAHGAVELRGLSRHPKYKTEPCRTFHTSGICPYGARCHFIHNAEERRTPSRMPCHFSSTRLLCRADMETLPSPQSLDLPKTFLPCSQPSLACNIVTSNPFAFPNFLALQKSLSADSLSDAEDSGSSGGSSGSESPGLGILGRRLPIFSQLSVSDD